MYEGDDTNNNKNKNKNEMRKRQKIPKEHTNKR